MRVRHQVEKTKRDGAASLFGAQRVSSSLELSDRRRRGMPERMGSETPLPSCSTRFVGREFVGSARAVGGDASAAGEFANLVRVHRSEAALLLGRLYRTRETRRGR